MTPPCPPVSVVAPALDQLVEVAYRDLRNLAHHHLRSGAACGLYQTTALVHETYLRLSSERETAWRSRGHVLGVAALGMRRIVLNQARRRERERTHASLTLRCAGSAEEQTDGDRDPTRSERMVALGEALKKLDRIDPRKVRIAELRFFAGLSLEEAARAMEISTSSAKRLWSAARLWLAREIARHEGHAA